MATVTAVPNPVIVGETFKIEGVGFNTEYAAIVAADGEVIGRAYANTSPEGGVIGFLHSFDTLGTHEVQITQEWPATSREDEEGNETREAGGDLKGKEDVEVTDGWTPVEPAAPEAEAQTQEKEGNGRRKAAKADS